MSPDRRVPTAPGRLPLTDTPFHSGGNRCGSSRRRARVNSVVIFLGALPVYVLDRPGAGLRVLATEADQFGKGIFIARVRPYFGNGPALSGGAAGYLTLTVDRLGAGRCFRPLLSATPAGLTRADVMRQTVRKLRAGTFGRRSDKVIIGGHRGRLRRDRGGRRHRRGDHDAVLAAGRRARAGQEVPF